jgi:Tfp pilus tip-associated adhesin PilY1
MLWFGTGRHLAADDRSDMSSQSVYGIVDRLAGPVVRSNLQRQVINVTSGMSGAIGGNRVEYAGLSQHGWVLDLPHAGERLIGWPVVRHGRLIFASLLPDADRCFAGASSIFVVDPFDGIAPASRAFVDHPGADFIASTAGIVLDLVHVDAGTKAYLFAAGSGTAGGSDVTQLEPVVPLPGSLRGRASWREVLR